MTRWILTVPPVKPVMTGVSLPPSTLAFTVVLAAALLIARSNGFVSGEKSNSRKPEPLGQIVLTRNSIGKSLLVYGTDEKLRLLVARLKLPLVMAMALEPSVDSVPRCCSQMAFGISLVPQSPLVVRLKVSQA